MALFQGKCDSLRDKTKSKEDEYFFFQLKLIDTKLDISCSLRSNKRKSFGIEKCNFFFH